MDDDERERIRKEIEAQAALIKRLESIERGQLELLAFKGEIDKYRTRVAWIVVLGAGALIIRPFVSAWDRLLAIVGLGQ